MKRRLPLLALSLAGLSMLTACISVLPDEPRPEAVFRLADPVEQFTLPATLVVREPDAPRLLASRSIASEGPQGGLLIVPGVAWADRATRLFQVTMVDSFVAGGGGFAVDDGTGASGDYELYWRLIDFNLANGAGVCRASLTLMDGATRQPLVQVTASARVTVSGGRSAPGRTRALAETGRDCVADGARQIAEEVERRESPDSQAAP